MLHKTFNLQLVNLKCLKGDLPNIHQILAFLINVLIHWPISESIHFWFILVAGLYSGLQFELCMVKTKMLFHISLNKILQNYNDLNTFQ